jgi:FkbM family methyltransferase
MKTIDNDLVFDIGANHGEDTGFYLGKGFRCVAVEANPLIAERLRERFAPEIDAGRLTLLNCGVWSERSTLTFYVNERNDHWSSFDRSYGTRQGTPYHTVDIPCIPVAELIDRFGVPRYMKIDVEGADRLILQGLRDAPVVPPFISVEEYGVAAIDDLRAAGYGHFQVLTQRDKAWAASPARPLEGRRVERISTDKDSGLFGLELPGPWLGFDEARALFVATVRDESSRFVGTPGEWWDVHATY